MIFTAHRLVSAAVLAMVLGLLSLVSGSGAERVSVFAQSDCTVTVQPGESIQKAIDGASSGAVICLAAGMWEENIEIVKSLTLRGAGQKQTKIIGREAYKAVIKIVGNTEIAVGIEKLTISDSYSIGIQARGETLVTIVESQLSHNSGPGIIIQDLSRAIISDSKISSNMTAGIWLWVSAPTQTTISNSQFSNNTWHGIWMIGSAQATISNSQFLDNGISGIEISDNAQAVISDSHFIRNMVGIGIQDSAQAFISASRLFHNVINGVLVTDRAQAKITSSLVEGNGIMDVCKEKGVLCNGITLRRQSQLELSNSKVFNNTDWGIAAYLKKCSYDYDEFVGKVTIDGQTVIEGNSTSNNQKGMGNPGSHPWNRPEVPDGQVCLP
uniref:Cell surface protein n=2 Tax=Candidatus Bipolaricaulota TaxID=67810 RepID=H5SP13_9BACT|nr:cell surface protein [uncultured Acetothermia bacterium]BAL57899.1 cell surface protein [uncultured Acetothermia bacterium]BAL59022.1 cell surface protein [Candidatus Acetothermum autotrophicum]